MELSGISALACPPHLDSMIPGDFTGSPATPWRYPLVPTSGSLKGH